MSDQAEDACGVGRKNKIVAGAFTHSVRLLGAAAIVASLSACSVMPDWAKPGFLYGDDKPGPTTGDDKAFPNLADVPGQKPGVDSTTEQKDIANGLAADRANAKYSDQVLHGGTEPAAPPPTVPTPGPVAPLSGAPADGASTSDPGKQSMNSVLPMPSRGGHATLAAIQGGMQTASAETVKADQDAATEAQDRDSGTRVNAAPTTPVEVKPSTGSNL